MNPLDQAFHLDHQLMIQQRTRRARSVVVSVAGLFVAGAIGTCVASSYDEPLQSATPAKPPAAAPDDKPPLSLMSLQLKEANETDELKQQIVAQRAEVKRLSDQLSALLSRMAVLEVSLERRVQQSSSMSASVTPMSSESPAPISSRPSAVARPLKKRAPERGPLGPTSVGGAPLTTASAIARQ